MSISQWITHEQKPLLLKLLAKDSSYFIYSFFFVTFVNGEKLEWPSWGNPLRVYFHCDETFLLPFLSCVSLFFCEHLSTSVDFRRARTYIWQQQQQRVNCHIYRGIDFLTVNFSPDATRERERVSSNRVTCEKYICAAAVIRRNGYTWVFISLHLNYIYNIEQYRAFVVYTKNTLYSENITR